MVDVRLLYLTLAANLLLLSNDVSTNPGPKDNLLHSPKDSSFSSIESEELPGIFIHRSGRAWAAAQQHNTKGGILACHNLKQIKIFYPRRFEQRPFVWRVSRKRNRINKLVAYIASYTSSHVKQN